jgi:hypothetical protein
MLYDEHNRPKSIYIDTLYHPDVDLSITTQMIHIGACIVWIYERFERRHVNHLWMLSFFDGGDFIGVDRENNEHQFARVSSIKRLKLPCLHHIMQIIFSTMPYTPQDFKWRYDFGHIWEPANVARQLPGSATPDYDSAHTPDTETTEELMG